MMDIRTIRKIIDLMLEKKVGEIELREGESSVRINFSNQFQETPIQKTISSSDPTLIKALAPQSESISTLKKEDLKEEIESDNTYTVKSPMVGTFYTKSSPEAKPFVEIGQIIKQGDTLCIVEAMKMFNQIESEQEGKIAACLVKNGQPVEYDQPLFIIKKE